MHNIPETYNETVEKPIFKRLGLATIYLIINL